MSDMSLQQVDLATLDRTWDRQPGITGWLGQCNHKTVGLRFIVTSMAMFLIAGAMALLMRAQLATAESDVLSPEVYNQLFTMHGTLMMFFFAVPMLEGLAIYFLPLQIGARDMPMPRVNALGYWLYLAGALLLLSSFFFGAAPDGGWYAYPPLTASAFSPGLNIDLWLLGVTLTEISAIVASFEIIALVLRSRAPGMSLARMPLFAWANLATASMILVAFPPLVVTSLLLEIERKLGTPFFDGTAGGDPLLWQHLFWWFGHPEVYIQLLPALGILATVIPVATRRRLPMRWLVVASFLAIAIVSFGLWVHHMFTTGIPHLALQFFSSASFMIAIPSGVIVLAFIAAFWTGRANFDPATLFAIGFLVIFVFGGITGVMVGVVSFNFQAHDTYFVVGHFHSVLIGGNVFPVFAGLYHWFPKVTGRHVSRRAGQVSFWLMLVGFLVTFVPQHVVGFLGMVRRIWTYEEGLGWEGWNLASSLGSGILGLGVGVSVVAFAVAWRRGAPAGHDPWGAPTLEWSTASPVPNENFATIPVVHSAEPRWGANLGPDPVELTEWYAGLGEPPEGQRESVLTTVVDGRPAAVAVLPGHSLWPLWLTVALLVVLIGVLFDLWWLAGVGLVGVAVSIVAWVWPQAQVDLRRPDVREHEIADATGLEPGQRVRTFRVLTEGGRSIGWWGTVLGVIALGHLVGAVLVAAIYLRSRTATWPPAAVDPPDFTAAVVAAGLALAAGVLASVAERRTRAGKGAATVLLVVGGIAAAVGAGLHLAFTLLADLPVAEHAYWSMWWLTGALGLTLLVTLALMLWVAAWHVGVRGVVRTGHDAELEVVRLWTWATAVSLVSLVLVMAGVSVWWG
ncbi:cbb3-type cytochrome c oxidase subunit I [Egicoccus sp. AB-alg6-2]|uniref:cytochrome c oxidase subunit I n=1 Tax=Egicoccus sp. AB-alg6-2 TaxID=3242692 RepID=UPI00359D2D3B